MTLKPCGFYCRSNSSSQPLKGYICYRQVISKFIKQYYILSSESWVKNIHIIKSESEKPLSCVRLFAILQARILEWAAFPFARGSSQPRDQTYLHIAGRFCTKLRHKGSPRILELVAYPFTSGSFQHRNWTRVSCISGRFFTNWAIREARKIALVLHKSWRQGRSTAQMDVGTRQEVHLHVIR